jgi:hypothetical protein
MPEWRKNRGHAQNPKKGEGKAQACENLLGTSIDIAQAFLYSALANSFFA